MYFSSEDRGEMMSMVYNWPAEQVFDISDTFVSIIPRNAYIYILVTISFLMQRFHYTLRLI